MDYQETDEILVRVGDLPRAELRRALDQAGVRLNDFAEKLLEVSSFDVVDPEDLLFTTRTVAELGFPDGATYGAILERAQNLGMRLPPLVSGPYVRLVLHNQSEAPDSVLSGGRAPSGAVHIASKPRDSDPLQPKGFYLRVVDGQRWLRGFRCDDEYEFEPSQKFMFTTHS